MSLFSSIQTVRIDLRVVLSRFNTKARVLVRFWSWFWFEKHEFYLTRAQCDEINKMKTECNEKERKDPYQIFILYNDFNPNPEMDESYFLDED